MSKQQMRPDGLVVVDEFGPTTDADFAERIIDAHTAAMEAPEPERDTFSDGDRLEDCPTCDGSGEVGDLEQWPDPQTAVSWPCPDCNGEGVR